VRWNLLGEETSGSLGNDSTDELAREARLPGRVIARVLRLGDLRNNTKVLPLLEQRSSEGLEFSKSIARGEPRNHGEGQGLLSDVPDVPILIVALLVVGRNLLPEGADSEPEGLVRDGVASGEREGHDSDLGLGVGLDGVRGNDTEGRTTTATESPEEVSVLLVTSSNEATVRGNDINAQDL
jgi:hypothetical protein